MAHPDVALAAWQQETGLTAAPRSRDDPHWLEWKMFHRRAFERYLASAAEIYAALPGDWTMLIEHKMYEPAFYATVIQDWGSSLMAAQALGPQALSLIHI